MKLIGDLRLQAARAATLIVAAGITAVSAYDVARAENPAAAPVTTLSAAIFPSVDAPAAAKPSLSPELAKLLVTPIQPASFVTAAPARATGPAFVFDMPLPGFAVNSAFGERQLSFEPHARMHEGVDIAAPVGTPIHATCDGTVARTGVSTSYGHFVEVAHADGVTSFYAHMSKTAGLKPGAPVKADQVLGYVGSTGHSTGPHLHFEIRYDGQPLDPQQFVGRQFASLAQLPLIQAAAHVAPTLKRSLKTFASWHGHVRGHGRYVRLASYHHGRVVHG